MIKKITLLTLMLAFSLKAAPRPLFNGKDLDGWQVADMYKAGAVKVLPGGIVECNKGTPMTGIAYTNPVPTMNYELSLEAKRVEGDDFFVALTIPVETNQCTIIIGGWGGSLCGISCIDYMDASENPYSQAVTFKNDQWYKLRVRLTPSVLQVFLDDDLYHARVLFQESKSFSLRGGSDIDLTKPLGLATYSTTAHWRNMQLTPILVLEEADKLPPEFDDD